MTLNTPAHFMLFSKLHEHKFTLRSSLQGAQLVAKYFIWEFAIKISLLSKLCAMCSSLNEACTTKHRRQILIG